MGICQLAFLYCCFKVVVGTATSKAAAAADLAPVYFDADLSHLQTVRRAVRLPLMRRHSVAAVKESTPHPSNSVAEGIETSTRHAANSSEQPTRKSSRSHNSTAGSSSVRRLSASFARAWAYASRHWRGSDMLIPSALAERMEAATLTSKISVGGICLMIVLTAGLSCYVYQRHWPIHNVERRDHVPSLPLPLSSADSDLDTQAKGGESRKQSTTTVPPTSDGISASDADESDGSFTPSTHKTTEPSTAQPSRASSTEPSRTAQSSKEKPISTSDRLSSPEPERNISTPTLQVFNATSSPRNMAKK